jgi:hypothetical protein
MRLIALRPWSRGTKEVKVEQKKVELSRAYHKLSRNESSGENRGWKRFELSIGLFYADDLNGENLVLGDDSRSISEKIN